MCCPRVPPEHARIVSLVPSWTETLYAYGLGGLVGVTRWCVHPKELVALAEKVGGTKDPDVARIVALRPDLVVCEKEENRKEDVEALREAGLRVWLSDVRSLDDAARDATSLREAVGRKAAGDALAARIEAARRELSEAASKPVPVYCPIWRSPWMTPTADTYAHHVLAAAGARNVTVAEGPLDRGWPERAPYNVIVLGGAVARIPDAVAEQLADGGRLLGVETGATGVGKAVLVIRSKGALSRRIIFDAATPLLPGCEPEASFVF